MASKLKGKSRQSKQQSPVSEENGVASSQVKIDTLLSHTMHQELDENETSIKDLIQLMNKFEHKISLLATKDYIDKSFKKTVTEKFVETCIEKLKSEITEKFKTEINEVQNELKQYKVQLLEQNKLIENVRNELSDCKIEQESLNEEIRRVRNENLQLKTKIDEFNLQSRVNINHTNKLEQYTRNNSIRIYGLDDRNKYEKVADSCSLVINMLNNKLKLNVSRSDIDIAHRLGPFREDGNRPIICKFVSKALKREVIHTRKVLKGSSIVIREDLTSKNAKLLERVSSKEEVKSAWSYEGEITVLLLNGKKIKIDLNTDLSQPLIPRQELQLLNAQNRSSDQ